MGNAKSSTHQDKKVCTQGHGKQVVTPTQVKGDQPSGLIFLLTEFHQIVTGLNDAPPPGVTQGGELAPSAVYCTLQFGWDNVGNALSTGIGSAVNPLSKDISSLASTADMKHLFWSANDLTKCAKGVKAQNKLLDTLLTRAFGGLQDCTQAAK